MRDPGVRALSECQRARRIPRREAVVALLAFVGACERTRSGSGRSSTEPRIPGRFAEIEAHGDLSLVVSLGGGAHTVTVEVDADLQDAVAVTSNGKRLSIRVDERARPVVRPRITVSAPDVALVRSVGAVDTSIEGVRNARFQLDHAGTGTVTARGATQKLKVFVEGAGVLKLEELTAEEALVHVSGNGSAAIAAPRHLEVELHGRGRVSHAGTPTIESVIRDAGKLERRP